MVLLKADTGLKKLYTALLSWQAEKFPEHTPLVLGSGNPQAKIIFIGEAPGKKEVEVGKPFMGASGKLLQLLLDSIDLQRDDVFITNTVKFRPEDNRDPTTEEKTAYLPWLQKEIEIIQPHVLVTLGRHALWQFIPDAEIGKVHGTCLQWGTYTIIPLYHPAAALYNGSLRQQLFTDFLGVQAFLGQNTDKHL